ncbi:hypothetical protein PUN28_011043 [Cardiocondyla obscurior]|uniref:Uncharacterized protein n=1 Tax=Cardiocondyla obscurior TaxID=286306 RepID=A0AAW2FLB7_9HYME
MDQESCRNGNETASKSRGWIRRGDWHQGYIVIRQTSLDFYDKRSASCTRPARSAAGTAMKRQAKVESFLHCPGWSQRLSAPVIPAMVLLRTPVLLRTARFAQEKLLLSS